MSDGRAELTTCGLMTPETRDALRKMRESHTEAKARLDAAYTKAAELDDYSEADALSDDYAVLWADDLDEVFALLADDLDP